MNAIRIAIAGAAGRMGRTLIDAIANDASLQLVSAIEAIDHPAIGHAATAHVGITADIARALANADCLIDFTTPTATREHLAVAVRAKVATVIGTTGLSASDREAVAAAAKEIPLVVSANMAVGVNVLFKLAEAAARIFGEGYDVEIVEAHHRNKVDAPSGTALKLGEIVARALGRDLERAAVHGREGITGKRDPHAIGFHAIRGGDIVGEHTVIFAGSGERVELTVRSASRTTYAEGALRAAKFVCGRAPGEYDMFDVLGIT